MLTVVSIDEKTTLMRYFLDLSVRNPISRGEFLEESWQFYMVVERVKNEPYSIFSFHQRLPHSGFYVTPLRFLIFSPITPYPHLVELT